MTHNLSRLGVGILTLAAIVALSGSNPAAKKAERTAKAGTSHVNRLIVHEWGTFTSIAGEDGTAVEWRPLNGASDLPEFVYEAAGLRQGAGLRHGKRCIKCEMEALVRMETPVLYFYADKETIVSVRVDFPKGKITEWYPQARGVYNGDFGGVIDWGRLTVLPGAEVAFPIENNESHYYPARETDAAPLRVCSEKEQQHEKFLFYESERVELLRRSLDGEIVVIAGGQRGHADGNGAQARFNYVIGMAWGPDGSLYVTDAACVRKITKDGTVTTLGDNLLAGVPRSEHPRLLGITVDLLENVYVADYDYGCVRQITRDCAVNNLLTSGFYWSPSGVAVEGDDLYVLEHQPESVIAVLSALNIGPYMRVRKLSADGTATTIATVWGRNTALATAVVIAVLALAIIGWRLRKRRRANRVSLTPSES